MPKSSGNSAKARMPTPDVLKQLKSIYWPINLEERHWILLRLDRDKKSWHVYNSLWPIGSKVQREHWYQATVVQVGEE